MKKLLVLGSIIMIGGLMSSCSKQSGPQNPEAHQTQQEARPHPTERNVQANVTRNSTPLDLDERSTSMTNGAASSLGYGGISLFQEVCIETPTVVTINKEAIFTLVLVPRQDYRQIEHPYIQEAEADGYSIENDTIYINFQVYRDPEVTERFHDPVERERFNNSTLFERQLPNGLIMRGLPPHFTHRGNHKWLTRHNNPLLPAYFRETDLWQWGISFQVTMRELLAGQTRWPMEITFPIRGKYALSFTGGLLTRRGIGIYIREFHKEWPEFIYVENEQ